MRCTQYKYITNQDFSFEELQSRENQLREYHKGRRNPHLIDDEPDITEATWINNRHVFNKEAFVPTIRDGLGGPIVSYWARIDNNRRWFEPPALKPKL